MSETILTVILHSEQDIVVARQRARQLASLLGVDSQNQIRFATAVSEMARNCCRYGGGGKAEYLLEGETAPQALAVRVSDQGPGIADLPAVLEGRYKSATGMGLGIVGARRLVDQFHITSAPGKGTTVFLGKLLAHDAPPITAPDLARIADELARVAPQSPLEEVQHQNRELLSALSELRSREEQLLQLNRELDRTNQGVVALYTEIDAKNKQLEQEVADRKRAEELLRSKNEDLKAFAYTVSHDLKAPLRGIAGYAAELNKRHLDGLSARAQLCITQVLTASRNMDRLIEDLLQYARLDQETLTVTDVNLPDLVDGILKDYRPKLDECGAQVSIAFAGTTVHCWGRALRQVLTNLIDNAIKFSRNAKPPRIDIVGGESDANYRISVSDNGVGFDMKYHDRIFGLFNRLVPQGEFEGTGAGLAIVAKLMVKLGGKVWAVSQPGAGATFFVEFPKSLRSEHGNHPSP